MGPRMSDEVELVLQIRSLGKEGIGVCVGINSRTVEWPFSSDIASSWKLGVERVIITEMILNYN